MSYDHDHLDADLLPLAAALDDLAARERAAAPADLEQRLAAKTLPLLRGEPPHAATPRDHAPAVIARIGSGPTLRLAAGVAIIATAGLAALLVLRAGPGPATHSPPIAHTTTRELIEEIDAEAADWFADLESLHATADASAATSSTDFWELPDQDALDTLLGEENS